MLWDSIVTKREIRYNGSMDAPPQNFFNTYLQNLNAN